MRVGIQLPEVEREVRWPEYLALARAAEAAGFDSIWLGDHLLYRGDGRPERGPWEAWTLLSALAAATERVRLGPLVACAGFHPPGLIAKMAATIGEVSGGRFVLGLGAGWNEQEFRTFGIPYDHRVSRFEESFAIVRGLLAGERVDYVGTAVNLRGVSLGRRKDAPRVPVYLGALGPGMLRLAGEVSDGAALNWCKPEQIAWSRERVAEGAARADRDPAEVQIAEYIRICVDDDEDAARRALARAILPYALVQPGASKGHGYRAHFARMGFDAALSDLEARRERGTTAAELADAFPTDLLQMVGYFGKAANAGAAFANLAQGLDLAIVRVVPVRPDQTAVMAVAEACQPGNVTKHLA